MFSPRFFFERTLPAASMRPPGLIYLSTSSDCESCTTAISTNSESMEASECGLTRGTCFVARRLEMIAVDGLLWNSWYVSGAAAFRFCFHFLFFGLTQPAARVWRPCLIYISTSMLVWIEATWCAFMYLFVIIILSSRL